MENIWIALGLTLFAGLATGIGSALAFLAKRSDFRFLSIATGFSAGVMLYVSFVEIFTKGADSLVDYYGDPLGHWINAASFFGGLALIGIIDALIPHAENPHEIHTEFETTPLSDPSAPLPTAEDLQMKAVPRPETPTYPTGNYFGWVSSLPLPLPFIIFQKDSQPFLPPLKIHL